LSSDWSMPRRTEQCAACGRGFEVGSRFRACLYEAAEGYERRDYCADCAVPDDPPTVGSWMTQRPEPSSKKVQPFDREAIYQFFTRLDDPQEPNQIQFRFVLALLLWRKKVIKLGPTVEEDGMEVWEFTTPSTGETHRVIRPAIDEHQLERLSDDVEQLLAGQPGNLELPTTAGEEEPDA